MEWESHEVHPSLSSTTTMVIDSSCTGVSRTVVELDRAMMA